MASALDIMLPKRTSGAKARQLVLGNVAAKAATHKAAPHGAATYKANAYPFRELGSKWHTIDR